MVKLGVIGHPIGQSLSPLLHEPWLIAAGLTGSYVRVDGGGPDGFWPTVRRCIDEGFAGLNVTVPYKVEALVRADVATDAARSIGAANLLWFENGRIHADNTDHIGFSRAYRSAGWDLPIKKARLLGAGGAAPAILYALKRLGVERLEITNRTADKANDIAVRFDTEIIVPWAARAENLAPDALIINSTTLGMKGAGPLDFDETAFRPTMSVIDIITTPLQTQFLKTARAAGCKTMNGIPMLVYQAVPSFERWTGRPPEAPAKMIAVVEQHLAARA